MRRSVFLEEFHWHTSYPEIFIRLTTVEALELDDTRFAAYIRYGCKLPIKDAPVKVQFRAMREELQRLRRCA